MTAKTQLVASLSALLLVIGFPLLAQDAAAPAKAVLASDLENDTQIIGHLGVPLGELVSITARIIKSNSKEADRYLDVLQVGDSKLTKPMRLMFSVWQWGNLASGPMPLNEKMVLRVYETGGMVGVPESAMKETTYVTSVGWGFRTSLVILYEEK